MPEAGRALPFLRRGPGRSGVPGGGGPRKAHLHPGHGAAGPTRLGGRQSPGAAASVGHQIRHPGADRRHGGQAALRRRGGVERPVPGPGHFGDPAVHPPALPFGGGGHAGPPGGLAAAAGRGRPAGGAPGLAAVGVPQHERLHGPAPGLHRQAAGGGGGAVYPGELPRLRAVGGPTVRPPAHQPVLFLHHLQAGDGAELRPVPHRCAHGARGGAAAHHR